MVRPQGVDNILHCLGWVKADLEGKDSRERGFDLDETVWLGHLASPYLRVLRLLYQENQRIGREKGKNLCGQPCRYYGKITAQETGGQPMLIKQDYYFHALDAHRPLHMCA